MTLARAGAVVLAQTTKSSLAAATALRAVFGAGGLKFAYYLVDTGGVMDLIGSAGHRLYPLAAGVVLVCRYLSRRHRFASG
jgi:hypothetical protein